MSITFLCPNGHELTCSEEKAGHTGRCPHCDSRFRIPDSDDSDDSSPEPAASGSGAVEKIEFLCPNGHRLFGPAQMAGRAGKCPHCEATFQIPELEPQQPESSNDSASRIMMSQQQDEEPGEPLEELEPVDDDAEPLEEIEPLEELESPREKSATGPTARTEVTSATSDPRIATTQSEYSTSEGPYAVHDSEDHPAEIHVANTGDGAEHSLPEILGLLWQQRGRGAVVELHLTDGAVLVPDFYSPEFATATHGLFATETSEGTFTLNLVAWESVKRISVPGVRRLPHGLFVE
jgi:hypothetical protein